MNSRIISRYILVTSFIVVILYFVLSNFTTIPEGIFQIYFLSRFIILILTSYIIIDLSKLRGSNSSVELLFFTSLLFYTGYLVETLSFFLLNSENQFFRDAAEILFIISQLSITIAPILLMIFISSYFTKERHPLIIIPVVAESSLEIIYQFLGVTRSKFQFSIGSDSIYNWGYDPFNFWINVLYYLSIVWLVIYLYILIYKSRKGVISRSIKEQQNLFLLGITLVFILSPLVYILYLFISNPTLELFWTTVIARSIVAIGLSIFVLAYLRSSSKIDFFQPQPMESIYIINEVGNKILYVQKFREEDNEELISLIINNIEALNSLFSELFQYNANIQLLELGINSVLIKEIKGLSIYVIFFVKYETQVLRDRFNQLIGKLERISPIEFEKSLPEVIRNTFGA